MDVSLTKTSRYDSVFWVEVEKILPNPYQPRKEFDEANLRALADSIRQYGVLQPLVVIRKEIEKPEGGLAVSYELIAGERRLRASKLIGLREVPVVIRTGGEETDNRLKLELAIIENLQREDLSSIDRAKAFQQLAVEFGLTHGEIGVKVGKSREYVSNTIRLLALPEHIQDSLQRKEISEGHARSLLMLSDKKEEQETVFKEIVSRKISVRDAEQLVRRHAVEKTRKKDLTPELQALERELTDALGTRVSIEKKEKGGGKVIIDFFSSEDLTAIRDYIAKKEAEFQADVTEETGMTEEVSHEQKEASPEKDAQADEDEELYAVRNFSL